MLTSPFHEVLPKIIDSVHVLRLVGSSSQSSEDTISPNLERLESLFDEWTKKRMAGARTELNNLLRENPVLEHWGRLQKTDEDDQVVEGMKDGGAESDEEGDGDEILGLKEMAMQLDLPAVEKVLKVRLFAPSLIGF